MTPSNPVDARYTLTELADLAGVTPRTVRYYLAQGLLPGVGVAGPGVKYDDTHLARLRLIKRLQAEHLPLADIRKQLEALGDPVIEALAAEQAPAPPADSALDYIRRITGTDVPRPVMASMPPPMASSPPPAMHARLMSAPSPLAEPPTNTPMERSQWERVSLAPDIELHIRRPLARQTAKRVDRLIEIARDLFREENQS
jgi:DNA-binding transcriptional MerR regulator